MGRGPFYTKAELCKAEKLKAIGLTWAQIGERFGRSVESLAMAVRKERRQPRSWA